MAQVKQGDTVTVHYTGRLESGEIFDSSDDPAGGSGGGPLRFTIGNDEVIPGFEEAVLGMAIGEQKTITIPKDKAYGERLEELVAEVEREYLPAEANPELGQQYEITQEDGQLFNVIVTAMDDKSVTLDANHPLAGRDLIFDIKLVEIV
jgi:peptidylprolyl isomerase